MKNEINNFLVKKTKLFLFTTLFLLITFLSLYSSKIQCKWTGIEKIVAVGDVHGDYDDFEKILREIDLIDDKLNWIGGNTHLVQTGDIMDRGPDAKKVFDLLMRLEKEAEAAQGKVHVLIGNHEEMNITGLSLSYARYVGVEQFLSFLPKKFREKKEREFRKKIEKKIPTNPELSSSLDGIMKEYWQKYLREVISNNRHPARRVYTNAFNKEYGKWLLKHNAIIKINDIVFVHGGVSEEYSKLTLEEINDSLRKELNFLRTELARPQPLYSSYKPKIVYDSQGPLWYRDLALKDEEPFKEDVNKILHNLNANYMVIAHTHRSGSIIISNEGMSRFEGKIWMIDTGMSDFYGGIPSALIIEKGKFSVRGLNDEE